jgi:hypothetical protein
MSQMKQMNFLAALSELFLGESGRVPETFSGSHILVFTVGSAITGLLVMILDWIGFSLWGRSFFGMGYTNRKTTLRLLALWGIGAGIGGYFGSSADIFQLTRTGCIGVSVGWPLILPRLIKLFGDKEDEQKPEDG